MNIIVCIKQVPDVKEVKWDPDTGNLIRAGLPSIINPNDRHAIEAALNLAEAHGGRVTVLSMGPPQVEEALRDALGMGAHEAIQLSDRAFAGADCWATAYTLGQAIKKIGDWDLVITGVEAMDGNTAQVGPEVADFLGVPVLSYALDIQVEGNTVKVRQKLGDVTRLLETKLPALITVEKEANEPRIAPMDCVMEACEKEIPVWKAEDLEGEAANYGLKGSPTRLRKVFTPKVVRGDVEIFSDNYDEAVGQLLGKLKEGYYL